MAYGSVVIKYNGCGGAESSFSLVQQLNIDLVSEQITGPDLSTPKIGFHKAMNSGHRR